MTSVIVALEPSASSAATMLESRYDLMNSRITQIVKIDGKVTLKPFGSHSERSRDLDECLALISVDEWRISFEANVEGFVITPPGFESLPKFTNLFLPVSTKQHRQSIILRPGDSIRFYNAQTPFHLTLKVGDDVEVGSSIPKQAEGDDNEIPETQEHLPRRAFSAGNRTNRTGVQVEESMQGLPSQLRSTTPAVTTQSEIVEETPTTVRKISRISQEKRAQTVASSFVSTPPASFAERPKGRNGANPQRVNKMLDLRSVGNDEAQDDVTTASESEDNQKTKDPNFSTAPEKASIASGSEGHALPNPDVSMEVSAILSSNEGEKMNLDKVDETPRRGGHPEVRIPPPRGSKKRASVERHTSHDGRPNKKSRKTTRDSPDSLASTIRVRAVDETSASTITTPARRHLESASEGDSLAGSGTSQRSSVNSSQAYSGKAPRVAFSNTNVIERDTPMRFLKKQGVKTVNNVTMTGCDAICIGTAAGTLVKSAKLLLGLALGKTIVSDTWVTKSLQAQSLLDPSRFPPVNAPKEWEWGNKEADVNKVLEADRAELFQDKVLFITPALKKEYGNGYGDIEKVAKAAGANRLISKSARDYSHNENTIILASENGDLEAMTLSGADKGYRCYTKDLLSFSILRGILDLENDEFKLEPRGSQQKNTKGAAGRKKKR